jgi:hypothetical protein
VEQYKNRLLAYLADGVDSAGSFAILDTDLALVAARLDAIYEKACKQYAPSSRLARRAPRPRSSTDLAIPRPLPLPRRSGEACKPGSQSATGPAEEGTSETSQTRRHEKTLAFRNFCSEIVQLVDTSATTRRISMRRDRGRRARARLGELVVSATKSMPLSRLSSPRGFDQSAYVSTSRYNSSNEGSVSRAEQPVVLAPPTGPPHVGASFAS